MLLDILRTREARRSASSSSSRKRRGCDASSALAAHDEQRRLAVESVNAVSSRRLAREIWLARPPCPRHERPPDRAELITDVALPAIESTVVAGCGGVRGRSTLPDAAIETHLKPRRIGEALHELEEVGARAREDEEVRGLERHHGRRAYRESRFNARWSDLIRAG